MSASQTAKVSIIIPTHNRCDLLQETLESVRSQSYERWECLVVDDGSTDRTPEVMRRLSTEDSRVKYHQAPIGRKGAPASRNDGARLATTDYLVFLDSDDLLAPTALENRLAFMESGSAYDFVAYTGGMFRERPGDSPFVWNVPTERPVIERFLSRDVPWQTSGPIWRKEFFFKIGGWDETLLCGQDSELHLRALVARPSYLHRSEIDHFIRMDNIERGSLGTKSMTVEGQLAHAEIARMFIKRGDPAMREDYSALIAGRLFFHALMILELHGQEEIERALLLWQDALNHGQVSPAAYFWGEVALKNHRRMVGDFAVDCLTKVLPPESRFIDGSWLGKMAISALNDEIVARVLTQPKSFLNSPFQAGIPSYLIRRLKGRILKIAIRDQVRSNHRD